MEKITFNKLDMGEMAEANELMETHDCPVGIEKFKELSKKHPKEPSLLIPMARLYGMLDMQKEHVAILRKVVASGNVSQDDAVELEARAHLLDPEIEVPKLEELKLTYIVDDVEKLNEHLLTHDRVSTDNLWHPVNVFRTPAKPVAATCQRPVPADSALCARPRPPALRSVPGSPPRSKNPPPERLFRGPTPL